MAVTFWGWTFLVAFWTINLATACPDKCNCIDNSTIACSLSSGAKTSRNVDSFRGFIANKTFERVTLLLDLDHTNINLTSLVTKSLVIHGDNLTEIDVNLNKSSLQDLNISTNSITKLIDNTFFEYSGLTSLNISSNHISNISRKAFNGLVNLTMLDLSKNHIKSLDHCLSPIVKLQKLNLSSNELEFFTEKSFSNLKLLQHLDLSRNKLSKMETGTLQLLPSLSRFILGDNPHLGEAHIDGQLLIGSGRRLQQLDISRLGLNQIPEAFTHSIRFLLLKDNRIKTIRCGDMDTYPLLQVLDLTNNSITYIEDDALGRLELLLFLHLNRNELSTVPRMLPEELKLLSLSNNLVRNITTNDFVNLPNLKILMLQNNLIQNIDENVFLQLTSLEVLDLSNNPLKTLSPSTFNGPSTLRDLRLCYLNLSHPPSDISFPLMSPEGLQMLHLRESPGLAQQFLMDSALLAALRRLQYLDLRINNITKVRSDLLFYLSQLKVLRLKGNGINCTSMSWLKAWLPLDKTKQKNEDCYFSSISDDKEKDYNCTFSEMFDLDDNLPPITTYSQAILNKLLKYYSRFNQSFLNADYSKAKINITVDVYDAIEKSLNIIHQNDIDSKPQKGEKAKVKKVDVSEKNVQNMRDKKILDLQNIFQIQSSNNYDIEQFDKYLKLHKFDMVNKTGKTVNKANNKVTSNKLANVSEIEKTSEGALSLTAAENEYKTSSSHSARDVGIISITCLIVVGCAFWITFRIRTRKRRREIPEVEEQIEVSNISGGVLW